MNLNAQTVCFVYRYDAACLLLVYGVYIVVLCFDLRISEFVLRKLSPCCTCLGKGSGEKTEIRPLMGWNDDTSLRVHSRSRTDSGIFQDDSGYSHLSLSLHGLNEIPEGKTYFLVTSIFNIMCPPGLILLLVWPLWPLMMCYKSAHQRVCLLASQQSIKVCLLCQRVTWNGSSGFCLCPSSLCFSWPSLTVGEGSGKNGSW